MRNARGKLWTLGLVVLFGGALAGFILVNGRYERLLLQPPVASPLVYALVCFLVGAGSAWTIFPYVRGVFGVFLDPPPIAAAPGVRLAAIAEYIPRRIRLSVFTPIIENLKTDYVKAVEEDRFTKAEVMRRVYTVEFVVKLVSPLIPVLGWLLWRLWK